MTGRQRAIINALRNGELDHFQIAADVGQAPFVVRGDLRALKRERYVTQRLGARAVLWDLTPKGAAVAAGELLDLDGIRGGRR